MLKLQEIDNFMIFKKLEGPTVYKGKNVPNFTKIKVSTSPISQTL